MRITSIKEDGKVEEFSRTNFHVDHVESVLEIWLEDETMVKLDKGIYNNQHAKL